MTKRESLYHSWHRFQIKIGTCPEFPYFGANYPDACCIEGWLWDLDKCDDDGNLYGGGEEACPFCNTKYYYEYHHNPLNGITREVIVRNLKFIKKRYGVKAFSKVPSIYLINKKRKRHEIRKPHRIPISYR